LEGVQCNTLALVNVWINLKYHWSSNYFQKYNVKLIFCGILNMSTWTYTHLSVILPEICKFRISLVVFVLFCLFFRMFWLVPFVVNKHKEQHKAQTKRVKIKWWRYGLKEITTKNSLEVQKNKQQLCFNRMKDAVLNIRFSIRPVSPSSMKWFQILPTPFNIFELFHINPQNGDICVLQIKTETKLQSFFNCFPKNYPILYRNGCWKICNNRWKLSMTYENNIGLICLNDITAYLLGRDCNMEGFLFSPS